MNESGKESMIIQLPVFFFHARGDRLVILEGLSLSLLHDQGGWESIEPYLDLLPEYLSLSLSIPTWTYG